MCHHFSFVCNYFLCILFVIALHYVILVIIACPLICILCICPHWTSPPHMNLMIYSFLIQSRPNFHPYPVKQATPCQGRYTFTPPTHLDPAQVVLKNRIEIRKVIEAMHQTAPFTKNSRTVITERSGKFVNDVYTPTANSWLLNPLLAHSILFPKEAASYFEKLPPVRQLENVGHEPVDFNKITKAISDLIKTEVCKVYISDIQRLAGHNYLYFSPSLQERIMTCLESHSPELTAALYTFVHEKFKWEREIEMVSRRLKPVAHLMGPSEPHQFVLVPLENVNLIGTIIKQMHSIQPFKLKTETILTERTLGPDCVAENGWYLNPIILFTIMNTDKVFPPLPTTKELQETACPSFDCKIIFKCIRELLEEEKLVTMTQEDIG